MNLAEVVLMNYPSELAVDPKDCHTLRTLAGAVEAHSCGDGLFEWIVRELDEAADDDPEEAIRLLERGKADIQSVIDGITEAREADGKLIHALKALYSEYQNVVPKNRQDTFVTCLVEQAIQSKKEKS